MSAADARLTILAGPGKGSVVELTGLDRAVIGRSSRCEVTIRDLSVSRQHAEIRRRGDHFEIRDLGSRNGTAVNGVRAPRWAPIPPGAVIGVGDVRLRFDVVPATVDAHPGRHPVDLQEQIATNVELARPRLERRAPQTPPPPTDAITPIPPAPPRGPAPPPVPPPPHLRSARTAPPRRRRPRRTLLVVLLLVVLPGVLVAVAFRAPFSPLAAPQPDTEEGPTPEPQQSEADLLVAQARARMAAGDFEGARAKLREALEREAGHRGALETMKQFAKEQSAYEAVQEAEESLRAHAWRQATAAARRVDEASIFAPRAKAVLERIEMEVISPRLDEARALIGRDYYTKAIDEVLEPLDRIWPGHPEVTRTLEAARRGREAYLAQHAQAARSKAPVPPSPRTTHPAKTRKKGRGTRQRTRAPAPPAPPGGATMVRDARQAFARGKTGAARVGAKAALDLGAPGAADLVARIERYDAAMNRAEAAEGAGKLSVALAQYRVALLQAKQVVPDGGTPARRIEKRLARLHVELGKRSKAEGDLASARSHAEKALRYVPGDAQARRLLDTLR